ncbi:phosphoglycerate mutase-like protein [Russula earlei]|uniref:Phosphoglycerate mutase-like protein n=1 Tax=Russula earlei TaxID=71964 RepID=A0ACC0U8G5_9AGAM|nr:phosphoglycerate mutase-like protein [Russula earlei]
MILFPKLGLLALITAACAHKRGESRASTFAGSTSTFQFPPPGLDTSVPDPDFPGPSAVGNAGPTPTGDEAFAVETAPAVPVIENESPVVRPDTSDRKGRKFDVIRSWGSLSPMFSLDRGTFGLPDASPLVPNGCTLKAVHILHRHGARYPTLSDTGPSSFAAKINSAAAGAGFTATGPLAFLDTWILKLGAEILTPFGRQQLYELGVNTRIRYGDLLKEAMGLPVWRTTSQERMVDSALQFAAGFFGVQEFSTSYHQLIEIESSGFNSTLAAYDVCPNSNNAIGNFGHTQAAKWASIYTAPIIKRLQPHINGVNLTAVDIVAMQETCAYESVALGFSSFCDLFTESEWGSFEYFFDLKFWYGNGPGNPTAAAQGIGYVSEVISRLTQTRIANFDTSVNSTIVSSDVTFPFGQPIFVDATHDTIISSVLVALNLTGLASSGPLPTNRIKSNRQWVTSHIVPFATNLVAQALSCPAPSNSHRPSSSPSPSGPTTHVRWILNDAVVPLTGVEGCPSNRDGLCDLPTYVDGTQRRIAEVDYRFDCFSSYSIPVPDDILDGRFPPALRNNATAPVGHVGARR